VLDDETVEIVRSFLSKDGGSSLLITVQERCKVPFKRGEMVYELVVCLFEVFQLSTEVSFFE
jgi:hypothetical protein